MPVDRHAKVELVLESVSPHPLVRGQSANSVGLLRRQGFTPGLAGPPGWGAGLQVLPRLIPGWAGHWRIPPGSSIRVHPRPCPGRLWPVPAGWSLVPVHPRPSGAAGGRFTRPGTAVGSPPAVRGRRCVRLSARGPAGSTPGATDGSLGRAGLLHNGIPGCTDDPAPSPALRGRSFVGQTSSLCIRPPGRAGPLKWESSLLLPRNADEKPWLRRGL